jgi:hypothetical protein
LAARLSCGDDPEWRLLDRRRGEGAWCAVLAGRTPRRSLTAARSQARIAAISNLLPTMVMTRVRL